MRFRSKPREIEATQWFPGREIPGVIVDDPYRRNPEAQAPEQRYFVVTIHRQAVRLEPGDWVVPESDGEHHYPIKPDEMAARYDPIDPTAVGRPEGMQLGGFAPADPGDRPLTAGSMGEGR
jgi:hypothetical protein